MSGLVGLAGSRIGSSRWSGSSGGARNRPIRIVAFIRGSSGSNSGFGSGPGSGSGTHRHRREMPEVFRADLRGAPADARALPPFPDPRRRDRWQETLAAVEAGNRAAESAGPHGTSEPALRTAERRYTEAKRSCRTLCAAYWTFPSIRKRLYPVVEKTAWHNDLG